jgi:hypothetical protein
MERVIHAEKTAYFAKVVSVVDAFDVKTSDWVLCWFITGN